jgi:hypothetical protein
MRIAPAYLRARANGTPVGGADAEEEEDSFLTGIGDDSSDEGEEEREEKKSETKANAIAEQANGVLDEPNVHEGRETDLHVRLGHVLDKVG